jgi:phage tail tape-measure protein
VIFGAGTWIDQDVNMIRYHDKRGQIVKAPNLGAGPNGLRNAFGDEWPFPPGRPQAGTFQFTVGQDETPSVTATSERQRAKQPKRNKQCLPGGLKVGRLRRYSKPF